MIDDECQLHSSHGQVEGSSSTDPFLERIDGLGRLCLSASQRPIAPPDALLERCDAVLRAAGDELQDSLAVKRGPSEAWTERNVGQTSVGQASVGPSEPGPSERGMSTAR